LLSTETFFQVFILSPFLQILKRAKSKTESEQVTDASEEEKLIQNVEKAIFEDEDVPVDL